MKSFMYYRYLVAEKLHKVVNMLLCCKRTDIALGTELDKEDIKDCVNSAKHIGISAEEYLTSWQNDEKARLISILLHTLEEDGYLSWDEKIDIDAGFAEVSLRLSLLGIRAKSILNDENFIKNPC